jgi:N utilization substance protein A
MNGKDILNVVEVVSNEKGVDEGIIFEAIEAALASATRRKHGEDIDARVSIDRETGEYESFRQWTVFADESDELEFPERELRMIDAVDINPDAEPGGFVEEAIESVTFGRIEAQTAKQVIVQKVREAERAQTVELFTDRIGELLSGIVKRVDRNGVFIDLGGNAEGFVARDQMVPREPVRPQDRIKALLTEVRSEVRGPQLFMTRTSSQFLVELFKIEVPEISEEVIEIRAGARDPGSRAARRRRGSLPAGHGRDGERQPHDRGQRAAASRRGVALGRRSVGPEARDQRRVDRLR